MFSTFKETFSRISPFLLFMEQKCFSESADAPKDPEIPQLSYLRVELDRIRPGMSDYIIRVATPKYDNIEKSNIVLSIRGNRSLTKYEAVKRLADVIGKEMLERGDKTHDWEKLDTEHLADLMAGCLKFFSVANNVDKMQFTTEALM